MQRLTQKRQLLWQQNRRTDRDRVIGQRRKKFLDLTDLLAQTNTISNQISNCSPPVSINEKINELLYNESNSFLCEGEDVIKAIAMMSDSPSLADKCRCTDKMIALLEDESLTLTETSFKIILRACVEVTLREPRINYEMVAALLNALVGKINVCITFDDIVSQIFLNLLMAIPLDKRTQIFYKYQKLFKFVTEILPHLSSTELTNRYIIYMDTIFSGCDQDTRDILLQNLDLIKLLVKSLSYNTDLTDSVLNTVSNIALSGSDMVEFLIQINLVPTLMRVFPNSKASTQNLVVVVFYNLVLSCNNNQIVYLCQNGLMQIIDYCLTNPINLECLHLALKLVEKLIIFIDRKYVRSSNQQNPKSVLRRTINPKLQNLKDYPDSYVQELTKKINNLLNPDSMQTQ